MRGAFRIVHYCSNSHIASLLNLNLSLLTHMESHSIKQLYYFAFTAFALPAVPVSLQQSDLKYCFLL
jgi:hypothetical protein